MDVVSEELNSVETNSSGGLIQVIHLFQKNLIVWKLMMLLIVNVNAVAFQKNLIVWKLLPWG